MNRDMAKRIADLLQAKNGGNQSELARYVGVTPQAVQQWVAEDGTSPRGKNLMKVAEFLGVSPGELQYGEQTLSDLSTLEARRKEYVKLRGELMNEKGITDPLEISPDNPNADRQLQHVQERIEEIGRQIEAARDARTVVRTLPGVPSKPSRDIIEIPVLDVIGSMGPGAMLPDHEEAVERMTVTGAWLRRNITASSPNNLALITGYGDSMEGTFNDGDLLLVDRGVTDIKIDGVFVLALNDELYIKRLQRRPDGSVMMISDNKKYEPYLIQNGEREKFQVLGRVVLAWNAKKM